MQQYKMNHSPNIKTNSTVQTAKVRNFMHSIDLSAASDVVPPPSAATAAVIPSTSTNAAPSSIVAAASSKPSSLPFLPEPSEFLDMDMDSSVNTGTTTSSATAAQRFQLQLQLQLQQATTGIPFSPLAFSQSPSMISSRNAAASFFPSNQRAIQHANMNTINTINNNINTINVKNPLIRAKLPLFRSAARRRTMITPSSLSSEWMVPFVGARQRNNHNDISNKDISNSINHTIDIDRQSRYGSINNNNSVDHLFLQSPSGGLFEADSPEIGHGTSTSTIKFSSGSSSSDSCLPQIPPFWDAADASNSNNNNNNQMFLTPIAAAPATSSTSTSSGTNSTLFSTPSLAKRVSLGLGKQNPLPPDSNLDCNSNFDSNPDQEQENKGHLENAVLQPNQQQPEQQESFPLAAAPTTILRPQASVGTSMAASVLMSLMVPNSSPALSPVPVAVPAEHPISVLGSKKKRRCSRRPMGPRRISKFLKEDRYRRHRIVSASAIISTSSSTPDDDQDHDDTMEEVLETPKSLVVVTDTTTTTTTTTEPLCEIRNSGTETGKRKNRSVTYEEIPIAKTPKFSSPSYPSLSMSPGESSSSSSGSATAHTDYSTCSTASSTGTSDTGTSNSASPSLSTFKRIPRRFIDDPTLPILKGGMRLAAPDDEQHLNSLHCFVRRELLEVFVLEGTEGTNGTTKSNANTTTAATTTATTTTPKRGIGRPRKDEILDEQQQQQQHKQIQRVGIRCVHCGWKPKLERDGVTMSTFFPKSLEDIYRGVCTWQRIHFKACKHMPEDFKALYWHHKDSDRSRGKKPHWVKSAHEMGLRNVDGHRSGIIWAGTGTTTSTTTPAVAATNKTGNRSSVQPNASANTNRNSDRCEVLRSSLPGVVTLDLTKPLAVVDQDEGDYCEV